MTKLKALTKELFSDDILYNQIKEKLIGTIIKYKSAIEKMFDIISKEYIIDSWINEIIFTNKVVICIKVNKRYNSLYVVSK